MGQKADKKEGRREEEGNCVMAVGGWTLVVLLQ